MELRPIDTVQLALTAFDNRLENAIANVTVARGPGIFPGVGFVSGAGFYRVRQNLDAVRARGVEADAALRLGEWRLQASYAFTDAEVRGSGLAAGLNGLRPAQTPRHSASTTLAWSRDRIRAAATLRYVGRQFEDDQNSRALDDALTVDAVLAVPLGARLSLEARLENLTDTQVQAAISADGVIERATPRTFWVGVRLGG